MRLPAVFRSLKTRLILLVLVFAVVPTVLYIAFSEAEARKQGVLLTAIRDKGLIIARTLAPALAEDDRPLIDFEAELGRYATDEMRIKLLLKPAATGSEQPGFHYVAAAPRVSSAELERERSELASEGVLDRLQTSCAGDLALALRIERLEGVDELLTSITPVTTPRGCFALVMSHTTTEAVRAAGLGEPFWRSGEVRIAAAAYLGVVVLVLAVLVSLWRNLERFGQLARRIGGETVASDRFLDRNEIPELAPVAQSFDAMVETLRTAAIDLRRAAEDNAHAFKGPLAAIRQASDLIKKRANPDDQPTQRALIAIDSAIERLLGLVQSARRLDEVTATLLDPRREVVDLASLARSVVESHRIHAPDASVRLEVVAPGSLRVHGSVQLLETVVENLVENALSFSPPGSAVTVRVERGKSNVALVVEDEGPGIPPAMIEQVFERYVSSRKDAKHGGEDQHFGVGLWIVRRNVEALGGSVTLENRTAGGLRVRVLLPPGDARFSSPSRARPAAD
ncbi:MAG: sensor histidine kinase [Alphaproteobacteria bacterium]